MNSFGQMTLGLFLFMSGLAVWRLAKIFGPPRHVVQDISNYYLVRRWVRAGYFGLIVASIGLVLFSWAILRRWEVLP